MTAPAGRPAITIGLVEDSDEDHQAFARVIERDAPGSLVRRWDRSEAALQSLAEGDAGGGGWPAILVVDLSLPGIDGCELVRRLRANPSTRTLPMFILSGSGRQQDIDRCYAAGANAYLTKPASVPELRALLQMLLGSLAAFQTPTPVAQGPHADLLTDAGTLEQHRAEYEARLLAERDAERQGRERAEALTRIASRLANLGRSEQVASALTGELIGGEYVHTARLESLAGQTRPEPTFEREFGQVLVRGTIPLAGGSGVIFGYLVVELDDAPADEARDFLLAAAELGGQALERIARQAAQARRAPGAGSDLPVRRWWRGTLDVELRRARDRGLPLCLIAIDLDGLDEYSQREGAVAADGLLLAVSDAWRSAGHDLLSRHGGEEFAAILPGHAYAEARKVVVAVRRASGLMRSFSTGVAQWDGREDGAQLVVRAEAALVEERRLRQTT